MSDLEHSDALVETGFWGRAGAGSLVLALDTRRLLVPLRSEEVLEPGTWGTWGGAIDSGEDPAVAALRELVEEAGLGSDVSVDMLPLLVFQSGNFRYHNFLAVVDREFEPIHNWESADSRWVSLDEVPEPMHPGLRALLNDAASVSAIRRRIDQAAVDEFAAWFSGSVIAKEGVPQVVFHGTTAVKVIPGKTVEGDRSAAEMLRGIAAQHGIPEASSVPSIFERWLQMGMAAERGVTPELAVMARDLYERSKPTFTRHVEDLGFDVFEMPGGGKELGVHFGSTVGQAEGFGTVFDFYLSMRNPLRMPDLGTWGYQSVIREARKLGVPISAQEYDSIFNARDENAALRELLLAKGYDGVVYENEAEGRGDSYIALSPAQIRRADPALVSLVSEARFSMTPVRPYGGARFQGWFEGSKCVDGDGKPLVVYHGSAQRFRLSEFEIGRKSKNFWSFGEVEVERLGGFFSPSREMAKAFAKGPNGVVLKAHLSIKNPVHLVDGFPGEVHEQMGELLREWNLEGIGANGMWELFDAGFPGAKVFVDRLKALGFDGATIQEAGPGGDIYTTWIAFDASQIRAVPRAPRLDAGASATRESVKSAIAQIVRSEPQEVEASIGRVVVTTSEELEAKMGAADAERSFDAWFGDSRVVDWEDKPMVVYHGTGGEDFTEFQPSASGWYGRGIYFTDDPTVAEEFAWNHDDGQRLVPVYLNIQRPYYYREPAYYERDGGDEANFEMIRDVLPKTRANRLIARLRRDDTGYIEDELRQELQKMGHDGIIVESATSPGREYIVFDSEQVKSAIGNRGTFDRASPDIRHSLAGLDARAQAFHDVSTNTTVFLADRIAAGEEAAVFLHETVHRHGRQALPEGRWDALVCEVKAWARSGVHSPERAIHDAAAARVATAGVAGALADEELLAYAVEEAVARGIEPSAAAVEGSAQAWLQAVVESIQRVADKLLGNDLKGLGGQDLVDLAYALAQLDSPEHGAEVREAMRELQSAKEFSALRGLDSIDGELRFPGVTADVVGERGKGVSIYGWSGDGTGRTKAALRALSDFGGEIVVHDPGEPGAASRAYWDHMYAQHLVQELRDEDDFIICSARGAAAAGVPLEAVSSPTC